MTVQIPGFQRLLLLHFWLRQCPVATAALDADIRAQPFACVSGFARCAQPHSSTHQLFWVEMAQYTNLSSAINQRCLYMMFHVGFPCIFKHHRGRPPHNQIWVFGMVDASHVPGLGYVEVVLSRDANTLLPIIRAHTAPGTTIHSDQWRAYNTVCLPPAVTAHKVVNHSPNYIDNSNWGPHIDSRKLIKTKLKRMKGCDGDFKWARYYAQ